MRPSALPLAAKCPGSYALNVGLEKHVPGQKQEHGNEFSRKGNAFHEIARAKMLANKELTPEAIDAIRAKYGLTEDEVRDQLIMLGKIDINLPPEAEVHTEEKLKSEILDLEGTPDVDAVIREKKYGIVIDYKSGYLSVEPPESNYQMIAYVFMLMWKYSLDTCDCFLIQPRHSQIQSFTFTRAFIEAEIPRMKDIIERAQKPNAPLCTGPWCYTCFSAMKCPAFAGAVVKVCEIMFPDTVGLRPDQAVEAALKNALPLVKAFARTAKKVEDLAKVWVDLFGPLDLGGGWIYQKTLDTRQEISVEKALPILTEKFPKAVNECFKITKTAIEGVARKTGVRGVFGLVMNALDAAGAIVMKPQTKYSFVNKGEKEDGRQITDGR